MNSVDTDISSFITAEGGTMIDLTEIDDIEFEYIMFDRNDGGTEAPIKKAWLKDGYELSPVEIDWLNDQDTFIYEWLSDIY